MMPKTQRRIWMLTILATMFLGTNVFGCGPFSLDAIFVYTVHPGFPLAEFARGRIGLVQPSYARSYLYVAYRYLNNVPLTPSEQKAVSELWEERLNSSWSLNEDTWIKDWQAARSKVAGVTEAPKVEVYRSREKPNEYETYLNCQKDAFDGAVSTLNSRLAKFGADNPELRSWVEAQDQVFANCSAGQHIPSASSSSDPLLQADRSYQIAAANFYAGNFDDARTEFAAIANDSSSPWHSIAPYLVARTLIRKASLGPADSKAEALTQAEAELKKILAGRNLAGSHPAANRLLDLVKNRLRPKERLHELAIALNAKKQDDSFKQALWDYTLLLDQFLDSDSGERKTLTDDQLLSDDLTSWIATFEDSGSVAKDRALSKWRNGKSDLWLVAAIAKVAGGDPESGELVAAALKVESTSPAFPSVRFHAARILIESGKLTEARTMLDDLLKSNKSRFDQSSLNALLGLRMKLAESLSEFINYSQRVPATLSWNDDGREIPTEASEVPDESKALVGKELFDPDAAKTINQTLPLSLLKDAALTNSLPVHLKRDLVQAVWIRAVLLGDYKTADELVPTLKSLVPDSSKYLADFTDAAIPDAKKFAAVYAWLKFPGVEPVVDAGLGRQTPPGQQDIYRDNWWCSAVSPYSGDSDNETAAEQSKTPEKQWTPSFLNEAEKAAGARQFKTLMSIGAAPNYLCRQAVLWGTKNPNDPRVPEALHLAVNTTRHGCTDKETGRWSKAAFDLLHSRYPTSTWAKKTPYWFKD